VHSDAPFSGPLPQVAKPSPQTTTTTGIGLEAKQEAAVCFPLCRNHGHLNVPLTRRTDYSSAIPAES
jgi:hypothetical protein